MKTAQLVMFISRDGKITHGLFGGTLRLGAMHRCKKRLRVLFQSRFVRFLTFFIFQTFLFLNKNVGKVHSGLQINKKHFQNNSNEIDL